MLVRTKSHYTASRSITVIVTVLGLKFFLDIIDYARKLDELPKGSWFQSSWNCSPLKVEIPVHKHLKSGFFRVLTLKGNIVLTNFLLGDKRIQLFILIENANFHSAHSLLIKRLKPSLRCSNWVIQVCQIPPLLFGKKKGFFYFLFPRWTKQDFRHAIFRL